MSEREGNPSRSSTPDGGEGQPEPFGPDGPTEPTSERVRIRCPTCNRQLEAATPEQLPHRPFCSRRCKLADLGRWLDEEYRISRPLGPDDHE